ncbi:MAG: TlpA family protein disulfide reductase [Chloroflexota bacterium]
MHLLLSRKRFVGLALLVLLAVVGASACSADTQPKVGQAAPNIAVTGLDGGAVQLADLKGKVVMLNFWASYCDPCKQEMPDMEKVYQAVGAKGVVVLGVNMGEDPAKVAAFVKDLGLTFPIALDSKGTAAATYGVNAIPASYFIDKDGVIRYVRIGQLDQKTIDQYLASLLQ